MKNYLFAEGFGLKVVKNLGIETVTWTFPSKPQKPLFRKIKEDYKSSYVSAMRTLENMAYQEIENFSISEERFKSYSLENSAFKKYLLDKLGSYNQEVLKAKNIFSGSETREYIDSCVTAQGDVIFLSKNNNFYGCVELAESAHKVTFENILKCFLMVVNNMIACRAYSKVPTKYVIGISPSYAEEFKNILEPHGILVTLMPQYPEAAYTKATFVEEYQIPLYIEVINVNNDNEDYAMRELHDFCKSFAN